MILQEPRLEDIGGLSVLNLCSDLNKGIGYIHVMYG